MNRILIPLDGSAFSAQIVPVVRQFFAPNTCELILYHIGTPTSGFVGAPPTPLGPDLLAPSYASATDIELAEHPIYDSQQEDSKIADLKDALEPSALELRGAGYSVNVEADLGPAGDAIVNRAQKGDIQLVAMTTHGRSGISRLLAGSVAEHVVQHVTIPVLLLHHAAITEGESKPSA